MLDLIYTGVGVGGKDCPALAPASLISTIFCLNNSFSAVDIVWYGCSTSLFFCSSNGPDTVVHIGMGAALSAMSFALLIVVHGAGMLASSVPIGWGYSG